MKKTYKKLDIIWRIIGIFIFLLFIGDLIIISLGVINDTFNLAVIISLLAYAIISVIVFLPPVLIKLFKKLRKKGK